MHPYLHLGDDRAGGGPLQPGVPPRATGEGPSGWASNASVQRLMVDEVLRSDAGMELLLGVPFYLQGVASGDAATGHATLPARLRLIVTEYNMTVQAFLVGGVDRIVNMNWNEILPPPGGSGRQHYLTAITRIDDRIVEIIDVEKVLAEIAPYHSNLSDDAYDNELREAIKGKDILIVDDSHVAIEQMRSVLGPMGLNIVEAHNGLEAYQQLMHWKEEGRDINNNLMMIITDAEMPEMDGYMLTTEIRRDPELKDTMIILHTSLSGNFNKAMVQKVGCDGFLSKFAPKEMAKEVQRLMRKKLGMPELS